MGVGGAIVGIGAAAKEIYKDFSKTFIPGACQTQLEIENFLDHDLDFVGSHVDAGRIMRLGEVSFVPPTKIPPGKKAIILVDSTGGSSQICVEYSFATEPEKAESDRHMIYMYGYNPKMDVDFYGGIWGRNIHKKGGVETASPVSYRQWRAACAVDGPASGNAKCEQICNAGDGPSDEGPWWEKTVNEHPTLPYHMYPKPIVLKSAVLRVEGSRLVCTFAIGSDE